MTPLWGVLGWIWRRLGSAAFAPVTGWRTMPAIDGAARAMQQVDGAAGMMPAIDGAAQQMEGIV